MGFLAPSRANANDNSLEALGQMTMYENVGKQMGNTVTDKTDSTYAEKADAVEEMTDQDRFNLMANDKALLQVGNDAFNAWSQSKDPDVRKAIADTWLNRLKDSFAYSLGSLKSDVKGFLTSDYQVKWSDKGELRVYDADGDDVTEASGLTKLLGFGNPQKQLANNITALQQAVRNTIKNDMLTKQDIAQAMNEVIEEVIGADGRWEAIGYAEDIGNAALATPERRDALTQSLSSLAPVPAGVISTLQTAGEGLVKAKEVGDKLDEDVEEALTDFGDVLVHYETGDKKPVDLWEGILKAGEENLKNLSEEDRKKKAGRIFGLFNEGRTFSVGSVEYSTVDTVHSLTGQKPKEIEDNLMAINNVKESYNIGDADAVHLLTIMSSENFEPVVYKPKEDVNDTIGYGTNLDSISKQNKEYLNSIEPDGYRKAKEGKLRLTKEQAAVLAINSYLDAKEYLENTKDTTALGTSLKKVYEEATPNVKRILIDMKYNMTLEGFKSMKNFWQALEKKDYITAVVELVDSKYLTQVGARSRGNAAALLKELDNRISQEGAWRVVRNKLEKKGKKDIIEALERNDRGQQRRAILISPDFSKVF
jgi:hypothetical protein